VLGKAEVRQRLAVGPLAGKRVVEARQEGNVDDVILPGGVGAVVIQIFLDEGLGLKVG
jgi:hypothetical protein